MYTSNGKKRDGICSYSRTMYMYFKQPTHTYMPIYNKHTTTKMVPILSTIPPHHPTFVIFNRTNVLPRSHQSSCKAITFNRSPVSLTKTSSRLVNILSSAKIEAMTRVYFTSLIYGETICIIIPYIIYYI
jgi:hypothetical protein